MSDGDTLERTLESLAIAADPVKYRLLSHAALHGSFKSSEAAAVVGEDPSNGTVRTVHAAGLERAGLVKRYDDPKVWYEITPRGRLVHAALATALSTFGDAKPEAENVAVLMLIDPAAYEEIRGEGSEAESLELILRRRLRSSAWRRRVFRISRVK